MTASRQPTSPTVVPFLDLGSEFEALRSEWVEAISAIGTRGAFILGPNVGAFQDEVAAYLGVNRAVGVASGTDALVLALKALGVGAGDEVITTPFTFFSTAEAVSLVGAKPVFADILADSFNLDPQSVAARVSERTRAIIPVHLFGYPADLDELAAIAGRRNIPIIEDAAQAFGAESNGARVGGVGAMGCFSFYPTKVLGCYGDGGLLSTNDHALADRVLRLRNHGATEPFMHAEVGFNSRLDEIQAALLRIKLRRVELYIEQRRDLAARYTRMLRDVDVITPQDCAHGRHVYNLYTLRSPNRDALREHLSRNGVPSSVCYPRPLHLQEVYASLGYREGDLPVAERLSGEVLSLPIFPGMTEAQIGRVCDLISGF